MALKSAELATASLVAEPLRWLLIDDQADSLSPILAQGMEPLGFSFSSVSCETTAQVTSAESNKLCSRSGNRLAQLDSKQ